MDYQRACGIHTGRCAYNSLRMQNRQMGFSRQSDWHTHGESVDESPRQTELQYGLAIVTSPVQCWQNLHTPCEALTAGTLFKELHLPFVGCRQCYRNGGLQ